MSNFTKVMKSFPKSFWVANTMEIFERWSWYGVFAVLALYLTNSTDTGALGFSHPEKGIIIGVVTGVLYLLPVVTGAIADTLGYKKVLLLAFAMLSSGYFLMGMFTSFWAVFFVFLYVAVGAALFKPVIVATISKATTDENSSIGFGIFYMMVNIGGFVGPICASLLRNDESFGWHYVFYMAAIIISLNFVLVIFFYKEPEREKSGDTFIEAVKKSFNNITIALSDFKFVVFLILIVGFWTMFNQIFYTLPNFIDQWVDTTMIYNSLGGLASLIGTKEGTIPAEMMINLDAGAIIILQLVISTLVMKMKPLNAMMSGILVCAVGVGLSFMTMNGWFVVIAILIFAIGEMASSPKFTEYVGKVAPKDKVALYMGCSFLPMAGGNFVAGFLSGTVYGSLADKVTLLKEEVALRGLQITEIGTKVGDKVFSQNDYFKKASELMGMNEKALTNMLWDKYNPAKIWIIFTVIGIATVAGLFLYDKFMLKKES